MIFHEAPHKLRATLSDMAEAFGADRPISLCRELTKLNEEIYRTTLGDALKFYESNEPRGEFVLVVGGATDSAGSAFWENMTVEEHVLHYIEIGFSKNDAVKAAAKDRRVPKNEVYSKVLHL